MVTVVTSVDVAETPPQPRDQPVTMFIYVRLDVRG